MAKTIETKKLEAALDSLGRKKREYGCEEVTIGFKNDGYGDEIVDYMSMDAKGVFRCYELKVTLSDLKTENKKSFYGDYNYLVVSKSLYAKNPAWDNYIPPYCGILAGEELVVKRQAKKKVISETVREMLKDSLLRSVFWKYENYKDAKDLTKYRDLKKQLEDKEQELQEALRKSERMLWTYQDFEFWYRKNHQDPSFSIENQAKEERKQYAKREKDGYTWILSGDTYICPNCQSEAVGGIQTLYCPHCGADLRK